MQVHLKGGLAVKNLLMALKDKDTIMKKTGVIYRYKCNRVECDEEYIGESARNFAERFKEHLKTPSPIHGHSAISGHSVTIDNFSIVGREDQNLLRGHKYILCIIDEVTNYLIMVPIFQARSEDIGEALIENVITKYCIPEYIIMDQESAFMSSLMTYLLDEFNIKIKTVAPYNHQSLQVEHEIKSLSNILTKHLTNLGQMWLKYLSLATFA